MNNSTGDILLSLAPGWTNGSGQNNGNLYSVTQYNGGPGFSTFLTFNQSFGYDGVNRLTSASDSGGWSQGFGYDAFGNMSVTATNGSTQPATVYTGQNQLPGVSYDAAGNQLSVVGDSISYDAESRQVSAADATGTEIYAYDRTANTTSQPESRVCCSRDRRQD